MLTAYFDESERAKGHFAVAGFAYSRPDAKRCRNEWARLFGQYGGCHMTDLASGQARFKGISRSEADRLAKEAVSIIKRRATYGVAVACHLDEIMPLLPKWLDGFQGAYPVCCHFAMMTLGDLIRSTGPVQRVAYVFESGHKLQGVAERFMSRSVHVPSLVESYLHQSHAFLSKGEAPLLQTADVFAWEWAKYWDETVTEGKRLMRRSLAEILTHGAKNPADFNSEHMKFTCLTGAPLRRFAAQVTELGLQQMKEDEEGNI